VSALSDRQLNPGSYAARALGCICPMVDNNYGRYAPYVGDGFGWVIRDDCTMHGQRVDL